MNVLKKNKYWRVTLLTLLILLFLFTSLSMTKFVSPEAGGSDSAGYLLNAKKIIGTYQTKNITPTKFEDVNCGALDSMVTARVFPSDDCKYIDRKPTYPAGLGLMHAISISIFGDNSLGRSFASASSFTGIIFVLFFFVYKTTKKYFLAFSSILFFVFSKQTIFSLTSNISDLPGSFWVLLTTFIVYLLFNEIEKSKVVRIPKNSRNPAKMRKKAKSTDFPWSILLVVLFSNSFWMLFLTREVNVIAAIPLFMLILRFPVKEKRFILVSLLAFGTIYLSLRYFVNGVLFQPSYGSGIFSLLTSRGIDENILNQLFYLFSLLGIGFFVLFLQPVKKISFLRFLDLQILFIFIFYLFYPFMGESWWDGRFVLSVGPLLIVSFMVKIDYFIGNSTYFLVRKNLKLVLSMVLIFSTASFFNNFSRNDVSPYRNLLVDSPAYRNVEPTMEFIQSRFPEGAVIVTVDFSASARYYLDNSKFKFLWLPELEKFDPAVIKNSFPETYWIYNSIYSKPDVSIMNQLTPIASFGSTQIDLLK